MRIIWFLLTFGCYVQGFSQLFETGKITAENAILSNHYADQMGNQYLFYIFTDSMNSNPTLGEYVYAEGEGENLLLQKLNADGEVLWVGVWSNPDLTLPLDIDHLTANSDGDIYILGNFHSEFDVDPTPGEFYLTHEGNDGFFVLKLSEDGAFQWAKEFEGDDDCFADYMFLTADNQLLISGKFYGEIDFDLTDEIPPFEADGADSDMFLLKLTDDGNHIWSKKWEGIGAEIPISIQSDYSGDIWVALYFTNQIDVDPSPEGELPMDSEGSLDVLVVKLNAIGEYITHLHYGSPVPDYMLQMNVDNEGNCYLLGHTFSDGLDLDPTDGVDYHVKPEEFGRLNFFQKIDSDGTPIWTKVFDGSEVDVKKFIRSVSGGYYLIGDYSTTADMNFSAEMENELTPHVDESGFASEAFMLVLNGEGNFLRVLDFKHPEYQTSVGVQEDGIGNLYYTFSSYDIDSVDLDPSEEEFLVSNEFNSKPLWVKFSTVDFLSQDIIQTKNNLSYYPNPMSDHLTIDLGKPYEKIWIKIMDLSGKTVFAQSYNQKQQIQLTMDLLPGMYLAQLNLEGEKKSFKFIKHD